MKLLFIRHGDPDYKNDALTERGRQEAALLADFLYRRQEEAGKKIDAFYLSPMGRAQATASYTLERLGRTGETVECLHEFPAGVRIDDDEWLSKALPREHRVKKTRNAWDMVPFYLQDRPNYFDPVDWRDTEVCAFSDMEECYDRVTGEFDALLAKWGYVRDGRYYRAEQPNHATLAFFCHFAITCVLLAHLLGVSPFALWQGFCAPPTSLTLVNTEEREKGLATFRVERYGSIPHLIEAGREPSSRGRFCECFGDE